MLSASSAAWRVAPRSIYTRLRISDTTSLSRRVYIYNTSSRIYTRTTPLDPSLSLLFFKYFFLPPCLASPLLPSPVSRFSHCISRRIDGFLRSLRFLPYLSRFPCSFPPPPAPRAICFLFPRAEPACERRSPLLVITSDFEHFSTTPRTSLLPPYHLLLPQFFSRRKYRNCGPSVSCAFYFFQSFPLSAPVCLYSRAVFRSIRRRCVFPLHFSVRNRGENNVLRAPPAFFRR